MEASEHKDEPVQLNEQREEKQLTVAIALVRTLEEQIKKEQMGKPKKKGITFTYYGPGSADKRSKLFPLEQAKADLEILMFEAGVYKEAQRRNEILQSELYDTADENRKAILKHAIWLQEWLTREVLQEINATPNNDEREYIMVLEEEKLMRQEDWNKENKERAIKMAEVARIKREKEELSKQEADDKLREIAESVRAVGQREAELKQENAALRAKASLTLKEALAEFMKLDLPGVSTGRRAHIKEAVMLYSRPEFHSLSKVAKEFKVSRKTVSIWLNTFTQKTGFPVITFQKHHSVKAQVKIEIQTGAKHIPKRLSSDNINPSRSAPRYRNTR